MSQLFGSLLATGSIFLINTNGVIVGSQGTIDAGGNVVLSALEMDNADFLNGGAMTFGDGSVGGHVLNLGAIASLGGDVVMIGQTVENAGTITAANGTTGLLAGSEVLLRDQTLDDGKFLVRAGNSDSSVTNTGAMLAAAAELKAHDGNVYALAGNLGGLVQATGVSRKGGRIFLTSNGGHVDIAGTLDASGADTGGAVTATGDTVAVRSSAVIDASGGNGGGTVHVGGAWQGGGDTAPARRTLVASGAQISANAINNGDGGEVVVWSEEITGFYGDISATGGAAGGNGGNAEVSGKQQLDLTGNVDLTAPAGQTGTLLVDPQNIEIVDGGTSAPIVDVLFGDPGVTSNLDADYLNNATSAVRLQATNDITITEVVSATQNLTFEASNDINVNTNLITSGSLTLVADADSSAVAGGSASNNDGTVNFGIAGRLSGGDITLNSGEALQLGRINAAGNLIANAAGTITDTAGAQITVDGSTSLRAGNGTTTFFDIVLDNNTLIDTHDFQDGVNAGSEFNATGQDIFINDIDRIYLGSITTNAAAPEDASAPNTGGSLQLRAGGTVAQAAGGIMTIPGTTTIASQSFTSATRFSDISLIGQNNFTGAVNADGEDIAISAATLLSTLR